MIALRPQSRSRTGANEKSTPHERSSEASTKPAAVSALAAQSRKLLGIFIIARKKNHHPHVAMSDALRFLRSQLRRGYITNNRSEHAFISSCKQLGLLRLRLGADAVSRLKQHPVVAPDSFGHAVLQRLGNKGVTD